jgi:hypothetical protein
MTPKTDDTTSTELFDSTKYELPIPKMDGSRADVLKIAFGGTLELDLANPEDLDLLAYLKLGREITLELDVAVAAKSMKIGKPNDDGDQKVTYAVGLRPVRVMSYDGNDRIPFALEDPSE